MTHRRHFYRDDDGTWQHESFAIDAADAALFAADMRAWAEQDEQAAS